MLFPEEDSLVLKDWIVKRLENTSVAPSNNALPPYLNMAR